jgi:hypothetical protein
MRRLLVTANVVIYLLYILIFKLFRADEKREGSGLNSNSITRVKPPLNFQVPEL